MGLFDFVGDIFGGDSGSSTVTSQQTAKPMKRPKEYKELWGEFMDTYMGTTPEQAELERLNEKIAEMESSPIRNAFPGLQLPYMGGPLSLFRNRIDQEEYDKLVKQRDELQKVVDSQPQTGYRSMLEKAYDEQREADETFLGSLGTLAAPYIEKAEQAAGVHSGLLSDILGKRMSGETVGPYAGDIDKLLGERTGISFGGGEPMQFITGSQQRLLSDLLGAQETALGSMQGMSENRMKTDIFPEAERYRLEREITDEARNRFTPSTAAGMSYLQNLLGMLQPMEMTRYHATPSVSGTSTATGTPSTAQTLGNIGDLFGSIPSIVSGIKGLFS